MDNTPKKRGRPKGSKAQLGLSLDKRLKILAKIATDQNQKPSDIIAACKEITALLNDKIKNTEEGIQETTIKFEEDKTINKPEIKPENKEELSDKINKKAEVIPDKPIDKPVSEVLEVPKPQEATKDKEDIMTINFIIDKEEQKD